MELRHALFCATALFLGGLLTTVAVSQETQSNATQSQPEDKSYQRCLTGSGEEGRCRPLQFCIPSDFRRTFNTVLDSMCIIERSFVGICCPENMEDKADDRPALPPEPQPSLIEIVATLNNPTCGKVEHGEWRWMVALIKFGDSHYCGGALISEQHVLTAAHCVVPFKLRDISVRLGEYDLRRSNETRHVDVRVAEAMLHPRYDRATYENDLAVLRLRRRTAFSSYVMPICLPPPAEDFVNVTAFVTGWGAVSYGGPGSPVLRQVGVPVWPQRRCSPLFSQPILDTHLCAGAYEGGRDSCQGDSGGPLVVMGSDGRWMIVGVVSWGIGCGDKDSPGIYTRVNRFLPWIAQSMQL